MSLINENETRELSTQGADLQLHTHRHRTPTHQDDFSREIIENRDCMAALGLRDPEHFCYPNGLQVGQDANGAVSDYETPNAFNGEVGKVTVELGK